MQPAERLRPLAYGWHERLRRLGAPAWLGPLGREPWIVLAPLLAVQWLALLALVLSVHHNGWLFYQGGDETFYYTTSRLLTHWTLPATPIGYGWPYLLSPIALVAGPNVLSALPAIVVLNTVVLLPVGLVCMYGIGARIGSRLLGYLAAALWLTIPYVAIPLFDHRFHEKYVDLTLPQALGFSGLADFPSMVCLLLGAYLVLRALDSRELPDAALAGLVAGFALALKASNGLFLFGPALAFLAARRGRQLLVFGGALLPALLTLVAWKARGLGHVPAFHGSLGPPGPVIGASFPVLALDPLHKYVHINWSVLRQNLDTMREFFWSVRPLEWIPFAGLLAIARLSLPKALLVFGWFAAFLVVKGTDGRARVEDASFFRLMMPSLPAYVLLLAAVPLLVPTLGPALARRFPPRPPHRRLTRFALAPAVALLVLLPLPLVLGPPLQRDATAAWYPDQGVFVPVAGDFHLTARLRGRAVALRWDNRYRGPTDVFYRVLRSPAWQSNPDVEAGPPILEGMYCKSQALEAGASHCSVEMSSPASTSATSWRDRPGRGRWTYRIGLSANWLADLTLGDVLLVSEPVTVSVP